MQEALKSTVRVGSGQMWVWGNVKPEGAKSVLKLPHTIESRSKTIKVLSGQGSFNTNWKRER